MAITPDGISHKSVGFIFTCLPCENQGSKCIWTGARADRSAKIGPVRGARQAKVTLTIIFVLKKRKEKKYLWLLAIV